MYSKLLESGPFVDARKNGGLTVIELEIIKRRINTTGPQETNKEENQSVEDSFPDPGDLVARTELSISINEAS